MTNTLPRIVNLFDDVGDGSGVTLLDEDQADRRRRALDGVHHNVDLILIYHGILVGIVFLFTVRHWALRVQRWRNSRRRYASSTSSGVHAEVSSASSSSSSSLMPRNVTPSGNAKEDEVNSERQPLLGLRSNRPVLDPGRRWLRKCHALAMYQPPNIPFVNKVLPSVLSTTVIAAFVGLNVFFSVYEISFATDLQIVFSDRTALLFAANLPWLYILAAKNQPLRFLTGYSYEGLNIIHRRLGEIMCLLPVLHGTAMLVVWWYGLRPVGVTAWLFFTHPTVVLGFAAFGCYEALYFTSLASFRNWCYEVFLASHIVLQCAALVILYFHHSGARKYVVIALVVFLVDRVVFRFGVKSKTFKADLTIMEDGETVLLSRDWALESGWNRFFGMNIAYGWKSMEHIFITVPALGKAHVLQSHPFTIASAAPEAASQHAWLSLIVRAHNGFTQSLLQYARAHPSAVVRVDGPYGSPVALDMLHSRDMTLLVAGGSGIAVAYPMIWDLLHAYTPDSEPNVGPRQKVGLLWIIHDASHIDWIGQDRLDDLCEMGLHLIIPGPTHKAGRPDLRALTRQVVQDMAADGPVQDPNVGVVVSGPDGMNRTVRNACAELAWEGWDIDVEVEKYGW